MTRNGQYTGTITGKASVIEVHDLSALEKSLLTAMGVVIVSEENDTVVITEESIEAAETVGYAPENIDGSWTIKLMMREDYEQDEE